MRPNRVQKGQKEPRSAPDGVFEGRKGQAAGDEKGLDEDFVFLTSSRVRG
jgi:hypothetical protein